ncbi:MAG: GlxA family transcriptional regulator [Alphaproteobacteria bacterium]
MKKKSPPLELAFLLVDQFSMMSYACTVEPLRVANRVSGEELYRWYILSSDGEPVTASNGTTVHADADLDQECTADMVMVCASINVEKFHDPKVFAWLRRQARRAIPIGGICTAALVLARAGLLDERRCTIHWENLESFVEEFPDMTITDRLFEIDRNRITSSGAIAGLDLMLEIIRQHHGARLAGTIADQFLHAHMRSGDAPQRMALRERFGIHHPKLLVVLEHMEANIEEPVSRRFLAQTVTLSIRQLERLFRTYLSRTLGQHYLDLRLAHAKRLLRQTPRSVLDIAIGCGFVSASHFSRVYRQHFGHPPTAERMLDAPSIGAQPETTSNGRHGVVHPFG